LEKIEMKKTLVALAAVSAVAAFAQTTDGKPGVQIQGLFSGGYQANSWKGVRVSGFDQNGSGTSQVNIRVLEDLGGGMSAYGRLENDFSFMNNATNQGVLPTYAASSTEVLVPGVKSSVQKTTTGVASTWLNGELAVGLRGPFGDLAFGALNNAGLNYIQAVAAPLQGTSFGGGYGMVLGADPTLTTVRWANSFRYLSPTINGIQATVIMAMKQNNATVPVSATSGVAVTTTSLGVGLNNQVGATEIGLKYANGPLNAGFVSSRTSIDSFCASPTTATIAGTSVQSPCFVAAGAAAGFPATATAYSTAQDNKQNSLAASYDLGNGLLVSGAYQKTTLGAIGAAMTDNQSARTANFYNVQYKMDANTFFVSVGSVKETASLSTTTGKTSTFTGAGYNYALSKNTALVARWESFKDDIGIIGTLQASTAYTSTQGTTATNNTRVRSMFGIHSAF
jgi:predicted porin